MEHSSAALLKLEWRRDGFCPMCGGEKPRHHPHCTLDLALAERGFANTQNREGARKCLELSEPSPSERDVAAGASDDTRDLHARDTEPPPEPPEPEAA